MPRLSQYDRAHAIGMLDAGISARNVAVHLQVHESTISRLRHRLRDTGSVADRRRSGRPRATTPIQDCDIVLQHLRDRHRNTETTAREMPGRTKNRICAQTVRNWLRSGGLRSRRPYRGLPLTVDRRRRRLVWARQHRDWMQGMWNQVLFSDESRFRVSNNGGWVRVYRRRGERLFDCNVMELDRWGGPSIMIWAGITANARTEPQCPEIPRGNFGACSEAISG